MSIFRRISLFFLVILAIIGLIAGILLASPAIIIPPVEPVQPVTAYVVDVGLHARLVLPDEEGGLVQYAYGDWHYFALHQQDWGSGIAALLIPTQGTLGRRKYQDIAEFKQGIGNHITVLNFAVSGVQAKKLQKSLEQRFQQNMNTQVFNPVNQMNFVKDDMEYTIYHNSNHELVVWLEDLDCRVEGFVLLANFQVKSS
ncbi:hypothetical protein NIES3974_01990 [Calothrix sp. NIES-3974]|nr:hypothetical protein NIES3974_01990 [Calothrix sp. NIES-3974]